MRGGGTHGAMAPTHIPYTHPRIVHRGKQPPSSSPSSPPPRATPSCCSSRSSSPSSSSTSSTGAGTRPAERPPSTRSSSSSPSVRDCAWAAGGKPSPPHSHAPVPPSPLPAHRLLLDGAVCGDGRARRGAAGHGRRGGRRWGAPHANACAWGYTRWPALGPSFPPHPAALSLAPVGPLILPRSPGPSALPTQQACCPPSTPRRRRRRRCRCVSVPPTRPSQHACFRTHNAHMDGQGIASHHQR